MAAISVIDTGILILDPNVYGTVDPAWTGTTDLGTIYWSNPTLVTDPGTSVINIGGITNNNTAITLPTVLSNNTTSPATLDPCGSPIRNGGKILAQRGPSGYTGNIPFKGSISGLVDTLRLKQMNNQQSNYSITGVTNYSTNVYKSIQPGYTLTIMDNDSAIINGGPALLPNPRDLISGATIYVNGINIGKEIYYPFKVSGNTYKLTFVSADYTNKIFHFTLDNDKNDQTKTFHYITQDNVLVSGTTIESLPQQADTSYVYELPYLRISNNTYVIDLVALTDITDPYYQKGQLVVATWQGSSFNYFLMKLPQDLNVNDAGIVFKIMVKQAVFDTPTQYMLIYSDTQQLYCTTIHTRISNKYFLPMSSMESVEITWDGYDFWVTNINKQPYMGITTDFTKLNNTDPLFNDDFIIKDISLLL